MTTSLALVEKMSPAEIFKPGTMDPIIERIRAEVRAIKTDISTEAGRKEIASLAFKVAKSKTFLDGLRKQLVEGEKKRLKAIDQEGARIWDALEELQKEVRQPLTDWENAEKERIASHEAAIAQIEELSRLPGMFAVSDVEGRIVRVDQLGQRDWQEFANRGRVVRETALCSLNQALASAQKAEADRLELERLRAAQVERDRQEREERISRESREKAEAEAKRREEHAKQAAEVERQRIENEKFEAEARAKQAESARLAAIEQAERDRLEAIDREKQALAKAEADKQAAVEAERQRAEAARRKEQEEAEARERNKKHKAAIHAEIRRALLRFLVERSANEGVDAVIDAIASGQIPHVKISY